MRTPSTTTRRLNARARARGGPTIEELALLIDDGLAAEPGHAAVHVSDLGSGELELGVLPIALGTHPFALLAGTVAPPAWSIFGLHVRGTAHHLETGSTERCSTTYLVHRDGSEVGVVRQGGTTPHAVHEPAEGTLPDLCRRVLQLPTPAPPASTGVLFALDWLDRVLGALALWPHPRPTAGELCALHASGEPDPAELVAASRRHAAEWPWARVRAHPEALRLPGSDLPAWVTTWMDDGAFARWALGAYPPLRTLADDVRCLLDDDAADLVASTIEAVLHDEGGS